MSKEDLFSQITNESKARPGQKKKPIQSKVDPETDDLMPHSLTIRPSKLNWLRNYVHQQKMKHDPYYTQGDALDEAIELLIAQEGDQPERPDSVKAKERKRSGRRKSK